MFDLEQAIAQWRQTLGRDVASVETLDELEGHLRDDIEQQLMTGTHLPRALEIALQHIGQAESLKIEFAKIGGTKDSLGRRISQAILTLANIPQPQLATNMNTTNLNSNIEPRWATYLKSSAFIAPAVFIWAAFAILCLPKLKDVCDKSGVAFPSLMQAIIGLTELLMHYAVLIGLAKILLLVFLERRSQVWPQYRRAVFGVGVFVVNTLVLFSLGVMVIMAILAAVPHVK